MYNKPSVVLRVRHHTEINHSSLAPAPIYDVLAHVTVSFLVTLLYRCRRSATPWAHAESVSSFVSLLKLPPSTKDVSATHYNFSASIRWLYPMLACHTTAAIKAILSKHGLFLTPTLYGKSYPPNTANDRCCYFIYEPANQKYIKPKKW